MIPEGHNWLDLRVSDIKVNISDAAQAVPDAVRNAPLPTQNRVVATTLAPGVVLMGGGSHNSLAVEFKDYVTVIEGPLNQERSDAVIAEVKKTFPNKPIRYLVNTHNHFDHLGGVRTYVAEGATVITDDRNRNFYERVALAPQPRSLQPDRLSTRPFAPTGPGNLALQTFTDRYTISDGNETIELYHVDGLNHSDNMLVAYLPKEKILVNADLYGPPPAGGNIPNVSANAVALFRSVQRLKLDVAQHVPIHGNPGPQADFTRIVGPVAARAPQQGCCGAEGAAPITILPSRMFAGPTQYPPKQFKAYGIVAFNTRPTSGDKDRYDMICKAYVSSLVRYKEVTAPLAQQMVTVWPIDNDVLATKINANPNDSEVCALAVPSYGLSIAQDAIETAKRTKPIFNDRGPYLLAWAPGTQKEQPGAPVLVLDLSDVINIDDAKDFFVRWREKIEQNSALWNNGWDIITITLYTRAFVDRRGKELLILIKLQ